CQTLLTKCISHLINCSNSYMLYVVRPGDGLDPSKLKGGDVSQYVQSGQEMKWMDFFLHIVPSNMFEAFAKGDILQ
ncbi:hypothetical protein ACT453_60605, partial [Bacillus sp. D-CC]